MQREKAGVKIEKHMEQLKKDLTEADKFEVYDQRMLPASIADIPKPDLPYERFTGDAQVKFSQDVLTLDVATNSWECLLNVFPIEENLHPANDMGFIMQQTLRTTAHAMWVWVLGQTLECKCNKLLADKISARYRHFDSVFKEEPHNAYEESGHKHLQGMELVLLPSRSRLRTRKRAAAELDDDDLPLIATTERVKK